MSDLQTLDDLPQELSYLKQAAAHIAAQDPELLGSGEAEFLVFENALRAEMSGLDADEVEEKCSQHLQLLQAWLKRRDSTEDPLVLALCFLVSPLAAAHEILQQADDEDEDGWVPAYRPRPVTLDVPPSLCQSQQNGETVVSDDTTTFIVREIDENTFRRLTDEFSSPSKKCTTPEGEIIYPQTAITLANATGTKNVVDRSGKQPSREITYFLRFDGGFVMVRLNLPTIGCDESTIETLFETIRF